MMNNDLKKQFQDSASEWAKIQESIDARAKKDKRIISEYCAQNREADIIHILALLEKYKGMPEHDEEIISTFKECYPKKLTVEKILNFEDVKEIYQEYLESGGDEQ